MRLACVFVPQLALQSVLRREPESRGYAIALFDRAPASPHARVIAATDEARRGGVRNGMTGAQAGAACPTLRKVCATPADVATAQAALGDLGFAFAPRIDQSGVTQGRIFFEVGDLERLYPEGEVAITQAIQARAARLGLGVRVAIASSKGIARVATRARELAVAPRGGERGFLAPLPVGVLLEEPVAGEKPKPRARGNDAQPDINMGTLGGFPNPPATDCARRSPAPSTRDTGTALKRWGIATVGALAMLPAAEVALRLGVAGARVHRLATGIDDEAYVPQLPADALEEETELDYAIYEIEPLSFVLRGLCDRALARLACRSLACAGITRCGSSWTRAASTCARSSSPRRRARRPRCSSWCGWISQRRPPDAGVIGAALIALPARVRSTQLDFLRPAGPAPDRLAATLARLAALVGPENVGAPQAPDTWREEAIAVAPYSAATAPRAPEPAARSALAVRRFRPAQEIEVLMGRDGPTALRGSETTARVLIAAGPYRIRGEWWRPPEENGDFARDYWDVHASDGAVYRLHQDSRSGRWFLDGYYD